MKKLRRYSLKELDKLLLTTLGVQDQVINYKQTEIEEPELEWKLSDNFVNKAECVYDLIEQGTYLVVFLPIRSKLVKRKNLRAMADNSKVYPVNKIVGCNGLNYADDIYVWDKADDSDKCDMAINGHCDQTSFIQMYNRYINLTSSIKVSNYIHGYTNKLSAYIDSNASEWLDIPHKRIPQDPNLYLRVFTSYCGYWNVFGLNPDAINNPHFADKGWYGKEDLLWKDYHLEDTDYLL